MLDIVYRVRLAVTYPSTNVFENMKLPRVLEQPGKEANQGPRLAFEASS